MQTSDDTKKKQDKRNKWHILDIFRELIEELIILGDEFEVRAIVPESRNRHRGKDLTPRRRTRCPR